MIPEEMWRWLDGGEKLVIRGEGVLVDANGRTKMDLFAPRRDIPPPE